MKQFFTTAAVAALIAGIVSYYGPSRSDRGPIIESASASQNSLLSPSTGTVSGLQLTNNYNNALDSVNTCNSGATAPTNQLSGVASLGNCWLNTTAAPYLLNMNDGASNWPTLAALDPSAHAWNVQIGGGVGTLASASMVDLCSTPRNYLTITGTVTITSFGSTCPAGVEKIVTFSGITQITYNAVSLIIPGAASIPATSVGDQARLMSLGGGNWQVTAYTPASGAALINPAVDLGTYLMTSLTAPPSSKYLFAFGQAVSRTTYASYMTGSTITQSVTRTNGSPTLTGFSDTTQIPTGSIAPIEGSGIPSATTIVSCTSTTCLMSANASSSGTANVQIFPNGNGDGSTTFNMPNCAGVTLVGRDNMGGTPRGTLTAAFYGNNPDSLGTPGGSQNHRLTASELPSITSINASQGITVAVPSGNLVGTTSAITSPLTPNTGSQFQAIQNGTGFLTSTLSGNNSISVTSNNTGNNQHPTITPSLTANCMVRVLAMLDAPKSPNSFASNDNREPVADRRRSVA